jgi:hypothetical protein
VPVSRRRKREKIHGLPPSQQGMDRNEKCRITAYARTWNAARKRKGQHSGPITRTFMLVLQALVFGFANTKTGSCFPSYEAIAKRAGCCRDTAIEAVKVLEDAGIVRVWTRIKRVRDRVLMTSNAYTFHPIGMESENPARNLEAKVLENSSGSAAVKIVVLDPRNALDAALIGLGRATGALSGAA